MQLSVQGSRNANTSGGLAYKWIVAIVVIFGAFMSVLDMTIVNTALPRLQNAFGADLNSVQWVLTAYTLTQGVVTPTTAFFTDRIGTKRFYLISIAIFTIGSAFCGLAWNLPLLITARVLQGIGGAFLFPLAITMLFNEFPFEQRGLASGLIGIAALLAPAVGPTLGGYFVTYADWPLIFYVNVPLGLLAIILGSLLLRDIRPEARTRFDIPGFILAATGLASLLYALSDASTDGWGSVKVLGFLTAGLLILCVFVVVELAIANRGDHPLVDLRLFANGPFLSSNIANLLITFAFFGGLFIFPIYMQNLRGLSALQSGMFMLPSALASIITTLIGGRLVDRFGVRVIIIPGLVLMAYSTWQFSYLSLTMPYWWIQVLYILRGLSLGLIIQPLNVSALSAVPPRQTAQASSLNSVVRFVSTSLGVAVLATLVQTQAKVHYSHLAELVTPISPSGQLFARLQAMFQLRGMDLLHAREATVEMLIRLVQRQGYVLAMQDAFWLTLAVSLAAIVATFLIRAPRRTAPTPQPATEEPNKEQTEEEAARLEAMLAV